MSAPQEAEATEAVEAEVEEMDAPSSGESETAEASQDVEEATTEPGAEDAEIVEPMEDPRDLRIKILEAMVQDKEKTLHEYIKAYKSSQAEFEAFKGRLERNMAEEVVGEKAKAAEELIGVLDNLQLCLEGARKGGTVDDVVSGVEMVAREFQQVLVKRGVEEMDPMGETFDPSTMEAMSVVPVTDPAQDGVVIATMKPGYRIGDREVRPALVVVGRKA